MSRQDRMTQARRIRPTRPLVDDAVIAIQTFRYVDRLTDRTRRQISGFNEQFQRMSGATQVEKRTIYFQQVVAEMSIEYLHDLAQMLDTQYAFVNSYRKQGEGVLDPPFTDANVTFFEANGVSD